MVIREASFLGHDSTLPAGGRVPWVCQKAARLSLRSPASSTASAIETRRYGRGTEKAYFHWTKRYVFFHGKRHLAGCRP